MGDWYTGRWWVGSYIWYIEEGPRRAGLAQSPPRCTKCNSPPINGQCTDFILFDVTLYNYLCALKGYASTYKMSNRHNVHDHKPIHQTRTGSSPVHGPLGNSIWDLRASPYSCWPNQWAWGTNSHRTAGARGKFPGFVRVGQSVIANIGGFASLYTVYSLN